MFELIEHTADIGFRAWGKTAAELFENAAGALMAVAVELETVEAREPYPLAAEGLDYESLMVNWLSEVLYALDAKRMPLGRFEVSEVTPARITGRGWGERWNPARHRAKLIVKGVTYHQLQVEERAGGWYAQVVLDI